jgi:hypothetical protein
MTEIQKKRSHRRGKKKNVSVINFKKIYAIKQRYSINTKNPIFFKFTFIYLKNSKKTLLNKQIQRTTRNLLLIVLEKSL